MTDGGFVVEEVEVHDLGDRLPYRVLAYQPDDLLAICTGHEVALHRLSDRTEVNRATFEDPYLIGAQRGKGESCAQIRPLIL